MDIIAVFTTVDSAERAQSIAAALVRRKLAACAQVSEIDSVYTWQGAIRADREYRIMAKTLAKRYADVEAAILELHPYDLPAVYALPAIEVFAPYAQWVAENAMAAD